MGLEYDPWIEAARLGLHITYERLSVGRRGEYDHGTRRIVLAHGLTHRQARATLTHEIMHAVAGDVPSPFGLIAAKQELLARRRTAEVLIDADEYAAAERLRDGHVPSIAYDLCVTGRVVADWIGLRLRAAA